MMVQSIIPNLLNERRRSFIARLKQALEPLERPYMDVVTTYDRPFSSTDHDVFTGNKVWLGVRHRGEVRYQCAEDEQRAGIIRRKEAP